jgi:hypothetical protein
MVWREKIAQGDMIVVRYADDLVAGFQHRAEAERFLRDFQERLAKFGLELHPNSCMMLADAIRISCRKTSSQNNSLPTLGHG